MRKFSVIVISATLLLVSAGNVFAEDTTAPAIPRGFDAAGSAIYELVLTWTNPTDEDLDHINVYFSVTAAYTAPSVWKTVTALPNTRGTVTIPSLASGTNYYVYLASVDTSGNTSAFTPELKRTTASTADTTSPVEIANFVAEDAETDGTINLSWNNSADDDFFQVRIHRSISSSFTPSAENEIVQVFGLPSASASYEDTGLVNDQTYYYKILTEDNRNSIQSGLFYPSSSATPTLVVVPAPEPDPEPTPEPTPPVELVDLDGAALVDGELITTSDSFDIFIVKLVGEKKFKRLILNPTVFDSYGHLEWGNVKSVSMEVSGEFTISDLAIETNEDGSIADPKVYKLSSDAGSDTGQKQWLNITAAQFEAQGFDWDAIYHINSTDAESYTTGLDITS